ncbi:Beta-glucuronosyltransferase GlcAT14A [Glycine max]|nr:Beta-glucuronosyltransferase GlcAT14A [Glycine max]
MGVERKWLFTLFTAAFLSFIILMFSSFSCFTSPMPFPSIVHYGPHHPPAFAYFISGGNRDSDRIFRLLLAVYHPRNRYLLHLGMDARDEERQRLAAATMSVPAIRAFRNVDVVGKADYVTYLGSSNVAVALRAASVMMKLDGGWDWFVTLSARDYPLVTQDGNANTTLKISKEKAQDQQVDLSHVFSSVRRDLNFIDHTSDLGWKEKDRFQPIVVDPGLYLARRSSPWVILSRSFLEYCIFGWDNLPRTLLMYFTNVKLSQEGYFHSVVCNAPEFKNTTVNGDLRYMIWDNPPKMEPLFLNVSVYDQMVESGAAFARQFEVGDRVLDMIDKKILKRGRNQAVPGAWCSGRRSWWVDPCSQWGDDVTILKPGPQAKKLEESVSSLLDDWSSHTNQCLITSEETED